MEKNSNAENGWQNKSRIYLIVGYILLVVMALFWSVDSSLVYIFFGLGAFFLFLGFYVRPRRDNVNPRRSFSSSASDSPAFSDLFSGLKQKKTSQVRPKPSPPTTDPRTSRRIATFIALAVFATFVIFFVGTILSSSNELDATSYYQMAEQNYWDGSYDSASENYRRALRLNEEYPEAMVGYGNVLAARNQPDSAVIMFDKALEIYPDYPALTLRLRNMGSVRARSQRASSRKP
jgi:tetratricopeptide (TPR) repeat protein